MPIDISHVKSMTSEHYCCGAYKCHKEPEHVAVFVRQLPLKAGTALQIGYDTYKVEKEAFLVFIDLRYNANFSHPVIYELHNVEDGKVRTIEAEFPIADPKIEQSLIPHILPEKEGK
ncbi:hypothetical protein ACFL2A_05155 [Thermodesulfobacteriota bacterium]